MDILLLFEPFSKNRCMDYLVKKLGEGPGIEVSIVYNWGLRGILKVDDALVPQVIDFLRNISCISMTYIVRSYVYDRSIERLVDEALETIKAVFPNKEVAIEVRRWDKKYPLTSIEIARIIARALTEKGFATPNPDSYNIIFVGVDKEFSVIGYADEDIIRIFVRGGIPVAIARNIIAIVERPQTDYEIMDLIQLSRAIGFRLRLYKPNEKALRKVLDILGIDLNSVEVVNNQNEALKDVDVAIALSMYAKDDEKKLLDLVKSSKGKTIAFVLGNEYEDVSLNLRSKCVAEVRLGPLTGFAMRTSAALAYALGMAIPILAGHG
ncbi:MAG: THUMP domain-containing protein [Ignisphaera sp.]